MARTDQNTVDDLQMRIAFLEQTQDELNEIVTAQQAQITMIERALRHLSSRLEQINTPNIGGSEDEAPPPHY